MTETLKAPPQAPPVVVTVPADLIGLAASCSVARGVEVCVRHEPWGVEVDCRPAGTSYRWTPIGHFAGGSFEVRTSCR